MIYVITAVHNRYRITEKFVKQLMTQTYKDIHLVLVDDASTDGTTEMVQRLVPDATIIRGNGKLWWGGALHEAYRWIKKNGDAKAYVMFANDDTTFSNDYIEKALHILSQHKNILLTGEGIGSLSGIQIDGAIEYNFKLVISELSKVRRGNCASTRSLFFRVYDFLKIGGFHPILLPHYASDYEWTIRACKKRGYEVWSDEQLFYIVNEETTGINTYEKMTRKKVFSKKSVSNPFYKFVFIFMVSSARELPSAIKTQILRYLKKKDTIKKVMRK